MQPDQRPPSFRAQRYPVRVPVQYRIQGAESWREGTTENISRSGVLFSGDLPVEAGERVEIQLRLRHSAESDAEATCLAWIVRQEQESGRVGLAAQFLSYTFGGQSEQIDAPAN
jgi:PilZ domain-containing protein